MTDSDLIDRLAAHKTLSGAPPRELEWLVAHGVVRHLKVGETAAVRGEPLTELQIVLSGHLVIYVDRGAGRHKVMEWRAGDVTGTLPYSRMVSPPGDAVAQQPTEMLAVPRALFPQLIRECHEVTSILVHTMIDRARVFTSAGLQDEKMISLGKMSAGLAHELNNPASAIERSAALLDERIDDVEAAARALGALDLSNAQRDAIEAVRAACAGSPSPVTLSPVQQGEREERIAEWLVMRGIEPTLGPTLADTNIGLDALDTLARQLDSATLRTALQWVAADCTVRSFASAIQAAAMRISGLVAAVRGFVHMDQAVAPEPVDLSTGLRNTVAVLNAKARSKSVRVSVILPPDLPRVRGFVGELNQIWANLIDNALDAVPDGGRVDVTVAHESRGIAVRVIDNGPGIPPAIRGRLFEPFFTTKPVGQGTGLGLDIVRRLVSHNDAEIEVDSTPGRTEFKVTLPPVTAEGLAR